MRRKLSRSRSDFRLACTVLVVCAHLTVRTHAARELINWRLNEVDVSVEIEFDSPADLGDYRRGISSYVESEGFPDNYSANVQTLLTLELERRLQGQGVDLTQLPAVGAGFERVPREVLRDDWPPADMPSPSAPPTTSPSPTDPLSFLLQQLSALGPPLLDLSRDAGTVLLPGPVVYHGISTAQPTPALPHPLTSLISLPSTARELVNRTGPVSVLATSVQSPDLPFHLCASLTTGSFLLLLPGTAKRCPCPAFSCSPVAIADAPPFIIMQLQPLTWPSAPQQAELWLRLPSPLAAGVRMHTWVPLQCGYQVTGGRKALQQLADTASSRGFTSTTFDDDSIPVLSPAEAGAATDSLGLSHRLRGGDLVFTSEHPSGDRLVQPTRARGARLLRWVLAWEDEEDLLQLARHGTLLIPVNGHTHRALPFSSPLWSVLAPPMAEEHYHHYYDEQAGPMFKRRLVVWDNDYTDAMAGPDDVAPLLPPGTEVLDLKRVKVFSHLMPSLLAQARAVVDLSLPGPERLVYEGVLHGAHPVITARHHGGDEEDLPLPLPSLRITDVGNASAIAEALGPLLTRPMPELAPLFRPLRHATLSLPSRFSHHVDHLLSSSTLHVTLALHDHAAHAVLPLLLSLLYHYPLARLTVCLPNQAALNSSLSELQPAWRLLADHGYTSRASGSYGSHPIRMVVCEEQGGWQMQPPWSPELAGPEVRLQLGGASEARNAAAPPAVVVVTSPRLLYETAAHATALDRPVKLVYPTLDLGSGEWGQGTARAAVSSAERHCPQPWVLSTRGLLGVRLAGEGGGGPSAEQGVLDRLCTEPALAVARAAAMAGLCEWKGWQLMRQEVAASAA